jgi:hypothetical protein
MGTPIRRYIKNTSTDSQPEAVTIIKNIKGDPGANGRNGLDGKSAYELAVAAGYSGTLAEWLYFLKGQDGASGSRGATGAAGVAGANGADGVGVPTGGTTGQVLAKASDTDLDTEWVNQSGGSGSGSVWYTGSGAPSNGLGIIGDFYLRDTGEFYEKTGSSTWTSSGSLLGPTGSTGSAGTNGTNGTNGSDGADGIDGREIELQNNETAIQWRYVGDVSWTDLVLLTDITGPQGDTGDQGVKGDTGDTGATGAQGPQGEPSSWFY